MDDVPCTCHQVTGLSSVETAARRASGMQIDMLIHPDDTGKVHGAGLCGEENGGMVCRVCAIFFQAARASSEIKCSAAGHDFTISSFRATQ